DATVSFDGLAGAAVVFLEDSQVADAVVVHEAVQAAKVLGGGHLDGQGALGMAGDPISNPDQALGPPLIAQFRLAEVLLAKVLQHCIHASPRSFRLQRFIPTVLMPLYADSKMQ